MRPSTEPAAGRHIARANPLPYLLLAIATLTWAGNFIVGRYIHDQIPPVSLSLWRWLLAFALLLPFTLPALMRQRHVILEHWRLLAALGASGIAVFHVLVYLALRHTEAINSALFMSTTPVVIIGFSWLLFRERVTRLQALGIAASLAGALILITRGDPGLLLSLQFNRGDLYMLIAVPNWALYSVLLRRLPPGLHPLALVTTVAAFGLVFLAPAYAWELARGGHFALNAATIGSVLYIGVFASVIAYLCWNRGVATVGANRAGLFMHLIPLYSAILAVALLGESVQSFHLMGAAFIFTGIYLTNRGRR